jgi:hypothetical protein
MALRDGRVKMFSAWTRTSKDGSKFQSLAPAPSFDEAVELLRSGGGLAMLFPNRNRREGKNDPNAELWVLPKRRRDDSGGDDSGGGGWA